MAKKHILIIKSLNAQQVYLGSLHEFPTIIMMRCCRLIVIENWEENNIIQIIAPSLKEPVVFKHLDIIVLLMGFLDKLVSALGLRKKEANVLVVGLDNSGLLLFIFEITLNVCQENQRFSTTSSQSRSRTPTSSRLLASMLRSSKVRLCNCPVYCTFVHLK